MKYSYIFILNVPAFYKINLLNELSKKCNIFVIFLGITDQAIINKDNFSYFEFDYTFLSNEDVDSKRKKIQNLYTIINLLASKSYDYLIFGGWDCIELIILMFLSKKKKNCIIAESSIYDSKITGIKGFVKRIIVSKISHAFVSGEPHKVLFEKLNYKGQIHITGGVGLPLRPKREIEFILKSIKYIYTGRLIEKKNLELLISVFNKNGKELTIVGKGELESKLRKLANKNISFIGFVENDKLGQLYKQFDCFILPSKVEQWGLVVEEALYYGLPVIASDRIGCNIDLILNYNSGVIFRHDSEDDLKNKIIQIENNYNYYKHNVLNIDFLNRDKKQVDAYFKLLAL